MPSSSLLVNKDFEGTAERPAAPLKAVEQAVGVLPRALTQPSNEQGDGFSSPPAFSGGLPLYFFFYRCSFVSKFLLLVGDPDRQALMD